MTKTIRKNSYIFSTFYAFRGFSTVQLPSVASEILYNHSTHSHILTVLIIKILTIHQEELRVILNVMPIPVPINTFANIENGANNFKFLMKHITINNSIKANMYNRTS